MNESNNNEKEERRKKRRRLFRSILTFTLPILGVLLVAGVIIGTTIDLGAFKEFDEYKTGIHKFTEAIFFTCIGVLCGVIGFERVLDFDSIEVALEDQKTQFSTHNKELKTISSELTKISDLTDKINIQTNIIGEMQSIRDKHFDPVLKIIFSDLIDSTIDSLKNGIENKRIVFSEYDRFERAYSMCLENLKPCHFLATASTHSNYFWTKKGETNTSIEDTIADFTKTGGKMTRIFLLDDNEFKDQDTIAVLDKQQELGVEVYTVPITKISPNNQKYFVIDDCKRISWHVYTDRENHISKFIFSANEREIGKYNEVFETLKRNGQCKKHAKSN